MLLIRTIVVTPFMQNARILADSATKECTVVDPGGDAALLLSAIERDGFVPRQIFLTHSHIDHAGGVQALLRHWRSQDLRPSLIAHHAEAAMRTTLTQQAVMFGLSPSEYENVPEPDVFVDDGDMVHIGEITGKVLFTPGHSPGHVSLFFESCEVSHAAEMAPFRPLSLSPVHVLIGGDAIFSGSIGRTDLPGGNHRQLIRSIKEKILTLPPETHIMCGHGPDTTVEVEIATNPFLQ